MSDESTSRVHDEATNGEPASEAGPDSSSGRRVYFATATAQERHAMRTRWEKALYGSVHFEAGMHCRYAAATAAEDAEKSFVPSGEDSDNGEHTRACNGPHTNSEAAKEVEAMVARWSPDSELPDFLFRRLSAVKQSAYIVHRLTAAERRIRYAPDYGSLLMMQHLNMGEMMLTESERLLTERGWMNEALRRRISELRTLAHQIKFDHDLD